MLNMTGGYNPMIAAQKGAKLYNRELTGHAVINALTNELEKYNSEVD